MSTEELNAEEPSVDSIAVEVQTLHNSFLSLEKNGEVTNTENKLMVHLSKTSTRRSTNTEARTWNIAVTTTSLPSSPSQNSPVQYVDERSKAMERKAELEELRNRNELTKKKAAFNTDSPMYNSTLASFFSQQKQMKQQTRQNRLGAIYSLNQYRLKECEGMNRKINAPPTATNNNYPVFGMPASDYSTMVDIDDFFRNQTKLDKEWRKNKEAALLKLHMYRQEHVGNKAGTGESSSLTDTNTARNSTSLESTTTAFERSQLDTTVIHSLMMLHAELKSFFTVSQDFDIGRKGRNDNDTAIAREECMKQEEKDDMKTTEMDESSNDNNKNDKTSEEAVPTDLEDRITSLDQQQQVLDPFSGTSLSFEEGHSEEVLPQKSSPSPNACSMTESNVLLAEDINDQQVLPSTMTNPSPLKPADSTISSMGSTLDGSIDRRRSLGDSSASSLSTFWREDAPLPTEEDATQQIFCPYEQYIPNLHASRGACERCLSVASEDERQKFFQTGRHVRIMICRGGCRKACTAFPRGENEPPVRLCRRCYFDTHRTRRTSTDVRDGFQIMLSP